MGGVQFDIPTGLCLSANANAATNFDNLDVCPNFEGLTSNFMANDNGMVWVSPASVDGVQVTHMYPVICNVDIDVILFEIF